MNIASLERSSDVTFRVVFSLIFVVAGLGHFVERDLMLARLEEAPLGMPRCGPESAE